MRSIRSPHIETRIGTGEAQVLLGNDYSEEFGRLGYTHGYNSEGAKKRRITRKVNNQLSELEFERKGADPIQNKFLNDEINALKRDATDPEFQKNNPNWQELILSRGENLKRDWEITMSEAEQQNSRYNELRDENPADYEGKELFDKFYNGSINYEQFKEDFKAKNGKEPTLMDYNAAKTGAANNVNKVFENMYKLPKIAPDQFDVTKNQGNETVSNRKWGFGEEKKSLISTDSSQRIDSALAQLNKEEGALKNAEDITWYNEVMEEVKSKHTKEYNSAKTPEEKLAVVKKVGAEYMEKLLLQDKSEVENRKPREFDKPSAADIKSRKDEKYYTDAALKAKKIFNDFQVSGDTSELNEYLSASGKRIVNNEDGTFSVEKLSVTGTGENRKPSWDVVAENLDMKKTYGGYQTISEALNIPMQYFEATDYNNTEEVSKDYLTNKKSFEEKLSQVLDIDSKGLNSFNKFLLENNISDDVEAVDKTKIKVKDSNGVFKTYRIEDDYPEEAKSGYEAVLNVWINKQNNKTFTKDSKGRKPLSELVIKK